MKKLLLYVGIIVGGILLSFPLLCGMALQQAYDEQIAHLPVQPGIQFEAQPLDRGWFSSSADIKILLQMDQLLADPELSGQVMEVMVATQFSHGPVLLTESGLQLGLGYGAARFHSDGIDSVAPALVRWLKDSPLNVHTKIDFQRATITTLELQPFSSEFEGGDFSFGGASVTVTSNHTYDRFQGELQVQAMSLDAPEVKVVISGASGSADYEGSEPYTMVGESVFRIPSVDISGKGAAVVLTGMEINNGSQLNQGRMNYFQTIEVAGIEAPLPLSSAIWHVEINGVSPSAVEGWADYSLALQEQVQAGTLPVSETGDIELTPEMEARLQVVMADLLQPGLGMVQQLNLQLLGAPQQAKMKMEFVGLPGVDIDQVEDPLQFLPAFKGELKVELDEKSMLNSPFAPLLQPYMQQGLLVSEQGKLVILATLQDGNLLLNDTPVPLQAMLEELLAPEDAPVQP